MNGRPSPPVKDRGLQLVPEQPHPFMEIERQLSLWLDERLKAALEEKLHQWLAHRPTPVPPDARPAGPAAYISREEAARVTGYSVKTIARLIPRGEAGSLRPAWRSDTQERARPHDGRAARGGHGRRTGRGRRGCPANPERRRLRNPVHEKTLQVPSRPDVVGRLRRFGRAGEAAHDRLFGRPGGQGREGPTRDRAAAHQPCAYRRGGRRAADRAPLGEDLARRTAGQGHFHCRRLPGAARPARPSAHRRSQAGGRHPGERPGDPHRPRRQGFSPPARSGTCTSRCMRCSRRPSRASST